MNRKPKCQNCPSRTGSGTPCGGAIASVEMSQAYMAEHGKGAPEEMLPCQWAIHSAEHNFCFWELNKELHGNPMSDKEICKLLGITQVQLKESFASAIQKLQDDKDSDEIMDLLESVEGMTQSSQHDDTVYLPDSFREKIEDIAKKHELQEAEDAESKPARTEKRGRKPGFGLGMPVHRSGTKTDLYSLSSKATRERQAKEKKKNVKKN